MAVQCKLCGYFAPALPSYISHLRLVHAEDPNFDICCGIDGCERRLKAFTAFSTHVYRHHRVRLGLEEPSSTVNVGSDSVPPTAQQQPAGFSSEDAPPVPIVDSIAGDCLTPSSDAPHHLLSPLERQKGNAAFLLKLMEGRRLSQVAIADVIDGCRSMCKRSLEQAKEKILEAGMTTDHSVFSDISDPFEGIDTPYLLEKFVREQFNYVEPVKVSYGQPYYTNQFTGSKRRKTLTSDKFYYIPLFSTLRLLLKIDEIRQEVLTPHLSNTDLQDYCDGTHFQTHHLFSADPTALQIVGYYDEIEVVNPLGSYVRKHKLGCLFFVLGNIPPRFRSTLKTIFLVAVSRSQDISKYGIDAFLKPFVEDLKELYLDGLTITINDQEHTFHGALLCFLADTLAAHTLGGYKESMSFALRICRSCMITSSQAQECYVESNCVLRCPDTHFEQCQEVCGPLASHYSTSYGINRTSILEEVPGFSVTTGLPHDLMHDLYEGVVQYELKFLLQHCVAEKYFDIEELNDRLRRYDFGVNKPTLIDPEVVKGKHKIRQSASQMMTLVQELPLVIGDRIPEEDNHWKSFTLITKICLSPSISPDTIAYLRILIEEKLSTFCQLYPEARIIPKLHYLVHYPSQIERFGPLINSWTMRHEAKLSFVKRSSRKGNFKNICKTVAQKHQLWLCYQITCEQQLLHPALQFSAKTVTQTFDSEPLYLQSELQNTVATITEDCLIHHHKWVQIQSSVYRKGMFVLYKYDPMYPQFGKIVDLSVFNSHIILFVLELYRSEYYDFHYCSYVVSSCRAFVASAPHSLADYHPLQARSLFVSSDRLYVSLHNVIN